MGKRRSLKERVFAFVLAVTLVLGTAVVPGGSRNYVQAEGETEGEAGAEALAEEGSGDDGGEGSGTEGDGGTTAAAEKNVVVEVTAPEEPFYPAAESGAFTAAVTEDDTEVESPAVVWSAVSGENGETSHTMSADGKLTVAEGTAEDTVVTVTAAYTYQETDDGEEKTAEGTTTITVSAQPEETITVSGKVTDSYKGADGNSELPLSGAVVSFAPADSEAVEAATDESGAYTAELVAGREYTVSVSLENYAQTPEEEIKFTPSGQDASLDIEMTTTEGISLEGEESVKVGEEITVTAVVPTGWDDVKWDVSSENEAVTSEVPQNSPNTIQVSGTKEGTAIVTASSHGVVSEEKVIAVEKAPVWGKIQVLKDDEELSGDVKAYRDDALTIQTKFALDDTNDIQDGKVTFALQKKNPKSGEYNYIPIADSDQAEVSVEIQNGVAAFEVSADRWKGIGEYRALCTLEENPYYEEGEPIQRTVQGDFVISGKEGQSLKFSESAKTEFTYGDTGQTLEFTGSVPNPDEFAANPEKFVQVEVNGASHSEQPVIEVVGMEGEKTSDKADGNHCYPISGTLTFDVKGASEKAGITLKYSHVENEEEKTYEDAIAEHDITVNPKELTVSGITYNDKIYDGTVNADVASILLEGVLKADKEVVKAETTGLVFDGKDVGEHTLNTDTSKGGAAIGLSGNDNGNYRLNQDVSAYKGEILPCEIGVTVGEVSREYFAENPEFTAQYTVDQAPEGERDSILNAIEESYSPTFRTDAEKESFSYSRKDDAGEEQQIAYPIYADYPEDKPETLKNYTFPDEVGILKIDDRNIEKEDYEYVPDGVSFEKDGVLWIREGYTEQQEIIQPKNKEMFTGVEYADGEAGEYFNPSAASEGPTENGTLKFRLNKKVSGSSSYSTYQEQAFQVDGDVSAEIKVKTNKTKEELSFSEKLQQLITFGIYGKKDESKATVTFSDEQSGLKTAEYSVQKREDINGYLDKDGNLADEEGLKTYLDNGQWTSVEGAGQSKEITFDDESYVVFAKAADQVGNVSYVSTNGIVIDTVQPNIIKAVIRTESVNQNNIYNQDVEICVTSNDDRSGIDKVDYVVKVNEATKVSGTAVDGNKENEKLITVSSKMPGISEKPDEKNEITVEITATDFAGNISETEKVEFEIDVKEPAIDVKYDMEKPVNEPYYKETRTAIVTITDLNITASDFMDILKDESLQIGSNGKKPDVKNITNPEDGANVYKYQVTFAEEDEYTFHWSCTDSAGNTATYGTEKDVFVVDKTAPEIEVDYDLKTPVNERYYAQTRTATVKITEPHFNPAIGEGIVFDISGAHGSQPKPELDEAQTKKEEGIYVYKVVFSEDDDYQFTLNCTDLSGNKKEYGQTDEFTIDKTDPKIQVDYDLKTPVNERYYPAARTATVTVTEHNFNPAIGEGIVFDIAGAHGSQPEPKLDEAQTKKEKGIYVYKVVFSEDDDYRFTLNCTDLAGREKKYGQTDDFTIDTQKPKIASIQYFMKDSKGRDVEISPGKAEKERFYGNNQIRAEIVVNEHNFTDTDLLEEPEKVGGLKMNIRSGNKEEGYGAPAYSWKNVGTDKEPDKYKLTVNYTSDANYIFSMEYTDLAGHVSEAYADEYFTVDRKAPGASIKISKFEKVWASLVDALTFGLFSNRAETVTIFDEHDVTSGVADIQYLKSHDKMTRNQLDVSEGWTSGKSLTIRPNERCVVYGKIIDRSGNYDYISTDGFVLDNVIDKPQITIETPEPSHNIYASDVNVKVKVEEPDPKANDDFSGLKEVYYEVKNKGEITQSGTFQNVTPGAARQKSVENTIILDAQKNNSNDVELYIRATDNADNVAVETMKFKIDITRPTVEVTYDLNEPLNGQYYNQTRTATIKVTERNFDKDGVKFNILNTDGTQPVISGWVSDGNAGVSDDSVSVCTVTFAADGDYTFTFNTTDLAGNKSQYTRKDRFTIDQTQPVVESVKYYMSDGGGGAREITPAKAEEERFYGNNRIYAKITVKEHNFTYTDLLAEPDKIGGLKTDIRKSREEDGYGAPTYSWENVGTDKYCLTVNYDFDANYVFDMEYIDLANNPLRQNYETEYFTVDRNAPGASIKISKFDTVWGSLVDALTFGLFSNQAETVTIFDEHDVTSGVADIQYLKSHDKMTRDMLDMADGWVSGASLSVSPNERFVVYSKIIDQSGNYDYISTDGMVEDDLMDKPQIDIVTAEPLNHIYASDTNVRIKVVDPDPYGNDDFSGLQEVYYEVRNTGSVTQSGYINVASGAARQQSVEEVITVDAQKNNSNAVQVYVRAKDNADNMSEETLDLKIDITKPTIQVTYDNNAPLNNKYYKETRTATVTVTERNFDPSAVRFSISNTDGTQPSISGWSSSADAGVSDNAVNVCTVSFGADGDYTFTLNCTDLAGNTSEYTQTDEFTIDKTVPTINVTYDNNAAKTPGYYAETRTATISINEHNFNGADVKTAITAALQGQGITSPSVSGWSQSGDTHTASVTYSADGDYTFDVDYSDLAGNVSSDYTQDKFTVDKTKPVVEIFDIEDKSANNGVVAPGVKYSDVNYDEKNVAITLKGYNHGEVSLDGLRTAVANGQSIKLNDFVRNKEMDDLYTLNARVEDKAGNFDEKKVTFSVNRFGSVYVLSDATEELVEKYYTNKEQAIEITEINVDALKEKEVSYGRDGELVKLESGKDYTVKQSGNDESWKQYTYKVKKENFEKEGNYTVTLSSEDRAKNKTNNKVKDKDIEFVVDKTKPTVVITGIEKNAQYDTDTRDVTVDMKDNIAVGTLDIYLDDDKNPVKSYDAQMLEKANGSVSFTLDNSNLWQSVKAAAVDAAGNEAETDEYRVLVTSNRFIQFYNNKPVLIGSIAAVFAISGGAVFLTMKRRRKSA